MKHKYQTHGYLLNGSVHSESMKVLSRTIFFGAQAQDALEDKLGNKVCCSIFARSKLYDYNKTIH